MPQPDSASGKDSGPTQISRLSLSLLSNESHLLFKVRLVFPLNLLDFKRGFNGDPAERSSALLAKTDQKKINKWSHLQKNPWKISQAPASEENSLGATSDWSPTRARVSERGLRVDGVTTDTLTYFASSLLTTTASGSSGWLETREVFY